MDNQKVHENYISYVKKEIGNPNKTIDSYARQIVEQYINLIRGKITLKEFELRTTEIDKDTPLNYIRNKILEWYPN